MHGYMHNRGGLPAALAWASVKQMQNYQNHQNRTPREERTAQKNSTPYNLNRAAPCPVTITGICGDDARITGNDQRNTHLGFGRFRLPMTAMKSSRVLPATRTLQARSMPMVECVRPW